MAANPPIEVTRAREAQAWELRQRCWTEQRIADEIGVHVATVSRMLDRVERRLAAQLQEQALPIKARQTAVLERVAAEALAAWERSQQDAELVRVTEKWVVPKDGADPYQVSDKTTERRGQAGDPALLAAAMKALADVREIWGLDAPKRTDLTSGGESLKAYVGFAPEEV